MGVKCGKYLKTDTLLPVLKMTFIKVIHWLFPFLMHFKDWPKVRSPIQINWCQLEMTCCIPMMSKATKLYQETMFCGPSSAVSCNEFINKSTYSWMRGSCSLIAFSEKACVSTRRIRLCSTSLLTVRIFSTTAALVNAAAELPVSMQVSVRDSRCTNDLSA